MAKGTGRAKSNIITGLDDLDDVGVERKDQYLKRLKAEDLANKKNLQKSDEWVIVMGPKVLRKQRNALGSEYTFYWYNSKKNPKQYRQLLDDGGYYKEVETVRGKKKSLEEILVPLVSIDHKPYNKRA
jgi:hypothetical protein